jgi:hypothetical protein
MASSIARPVVAPRRRSRQGEDRLDCRVGIGFTMPEFATGDANIDDHVVLRMSSSFAFYNQPGAPTASRCPDVADAPSLTSMWVKILGRKVLGLILMPVFCTAVCGEKLLTKRSIQHGWPTIFQAGDIDVFGQPGGRGRFGVRTASLEQSDRFPSAARVDDPFFAIIGPI